MDARQRHHDVARLHAACINQGFLPTLGLPFLALLYQAMEEASGSVLLVEEVDGRIVGFVSGALGMGAIYRQMLRHPIRLTTALLPSLIRPRRLLRMLEIVRYGRDTRAEHGASPVAELLSIAVLPDVRGRGVAERLYRALVMHFRERGIDAFKITVGDALAPAHRFYERMGACAITHVEVHQGEGSVVYVQNTRFIPPAA